MHTLGFVFLAILGLTNAQLGLNGLRNRNIADTVITGPSGTVVANRGIGAGVFNPLSALSSVAPVAAVAPVAPIAKIAHAHPLPLAQVTPLAAALTNLGLFQPGLASGILANSGLFNNGLLTNGLAAQLLANGLVGNGIVAGL